MTSKHILALAVAASLVSFASTASGNVKNQIGSNLPNIAITFRNNSNGQEYPTTPAATNTSGNYGPITLPAGTYTVTLREPSPSTNSAVVPNVAVSGSTSRSF